MQDAYDNGGERAQTQTTSSSFVERGDSGACAGDIQEQIGATVEDLKSKAASVKQKVADAGRRTAETVDSKREPTAKTLESAANTLRQGSDRVTDATSRAAYGTADKLEATAGYIRENDLRSMMEDAQGVVRRHPGPALAVAAVAGFLVGKALFTGRD